MKNTNRTQQETAKNIFLPYYTSTSALQKAKEAITNFLYVNIVQGSNVDISKLSVWDVYYNPWIEIIGRDHLLELLYYTLGKNNNLIDINNHTISTEWIQKINEIIQYTNKYYNRFKPTIVSYIKNKNTSNTNIENFETKDEILDFFETILLTKKTSKTFKLKQVLNEWKSKIMHLIKKDTRSVDYNDFIKRSVYWGYSLLFYVIAHLYLSKEFKDRWQIFRKIVEALDINDFEILEKEDIIWHTYHIDHFQKLSNDSELNSSVTDFKIIWNTKWLKSTIEKLLHDRAYDFVTDFKDIYRFTITKSNLEELSKIMSHFYNKFPNAKIVDRWLWKNIYNILKSQNIDNIENKLQKSLQDSFAEYHPHYSDLRLIIEFEKWITFELRFMTDEWYQNEKTHEYAAHELYKIIWHLRGKSRNHKALTKNSVISFIVRKITKGHNKVNIVDKIYNWDITKTAETLTNKINKNFHIIAYEWEYYYIHKDEFNNLDKLEYFPKWFTKIEDESCKINAKDVLEILNTKKIQP